MLLSEFNNSVTRGGRSDRLCASSNECFDRPGEVTPRKLEKLPLVAQSDAPTTKRLRAFGQHTFPSGNLKRIRAAMLPRQALTKTSDTFPSFRRSTRSRHQLQTSCHLKTCMHRKKIPMATAAQRNGLIHVSVSVAVKFAECGSIFPRRASKEHSGIAAPYRDEPQW